MSKPYYQDEAVTIYHGDCGRKAIGIEIEERYCEIAAKRMAQSVMQFGEGRR